MIDPKIENIYNIILSLFLGIVVALVVNELYKKPITIIIYKNNKK